MPVRTNKPLVILLVVLLLPIAEAQQRRRPGQPVEPLPPASIPDRQPAKPKVIAPVVASPPEAEEPPPPQTVRRLPGNQTPIIEEQTSPLPVVAGERRRTSELTEAGDASTPPGELLAEDPNRRAGLIPVAKPAPEARYLKEVVEDRWQLTKELGLTSASLLDPYNQNTLKGDRPLYDDWFFSLGLVSDTVFESRRIPTPVGAQAEGSAGQLDVIGDGEQSVFAETVSATLVYYKGDTTFKPPEYEYHATFAYQLNRVDVEQVRALRVDPRTGKSRNDDHLGVQELFVDKHLRDVSARYDFDSLRIGIQPFTADFRGFLFQDLQLGVRLFGTRDNNQWQYNLAYFRRLEKDTNSLLNDLGKPLRADDIYVFNLYKQDFPVLGHTSQLVLLHNRNREGKEGRYFNNNGFIERPASLGREAYRNYEVSYLGLNGDGHFGRYNLTSSLYYAFGQQDEGVLHAGSVDIRSFFAAAEASVDFDWRRIRLSALYASPDDDPFDDVETGFDAVFESPLFAGGTDTNYWTRQSVPLIGGGIVGIAGRNGQLNSLRSSLAEGQSNFANPGTVLLGLGVDLDLMAQLRVSFNANQLWFADSAVIEVFRNQGPVARDIGTDFSVATIWRPFMTQNVIFRGSVAALVPGQAYRQLFGDEVGYSVLLNLILTY